MISIEFTEEAIKQLFKERYEHPHPRVQQRLEALYLKSQGIAHGKICQILNISARSFVNWLYIYKSEGIKGLKKLNWKGSQGSLSSHKQTLEDYFRENPPSSVREACQKIKELTGIERRETSVRCFLKSIGMSFRKTGLVPGKADPVKQEEFKKKAWSLF